MRRIHVATFLSMLLLLICPFSMLHHTKAEARQVFLSKDFVYYYTLSDGKATIVSYNALPDPQYELFAPSRILVPSQIDKYPVMAIGDSAFSNAWNTTSYNGKRTVRQITVVIPEGIESIGTKAFLGCTGLVSIALPSTLKAIGDSAFMFCEALADVTLSHGLFSIGETAFFGCKSLENLSIPSSVMRLGHDPFDRDTITLEVVKDSVAYTYAWMNYHTVIVQPDLSASEEWRTSEDQNYVYLVNDESATLLQYLGDDLHVVIPETLDGYPVTAIGYLAFFEQDISLFAGKDILSVMIPEGISYIGQNAFYRCKYLESVAIPSSVAVIDDGAFQECPRLREVNVAAGVEVIGRSAFSKCTSLEALVIPASVNAIGSEAFLDCAGLVDVTIPDGVVRIDANAFRNCVNLKELALPKSVTDIGYGAFLDCAEEFTLKVIPGSDAESFAQKNKIKYERVQQAGSVGDAYAQVVITSSGSVNLRAEGSADSQPVGKASSGDVFQCVGVADTGWYEILLPDGRTAYVSPKLSEYVE